MGVVVAATAGVDSGIGDGVTVDVGSGVGITVTVGTGVEVAVGAVLGSSTVCAVCDSFGTTSSSFAKQYNKIKTQITCPKIIAAFLK